MKKNKGFTLIELMVVILIVAILAAVLAPMMSGRIRAAKWSEGKAGAGTLATALRAYVSEHEGAGDLDGSAAITDFSELGVDNADLTGKYFTVANYEITSFDYDDTRDPPLYYVITVDAPDFDPDGTVTLTTSGAGVNVFAGP